MCLGRKTAWAMRCPCRRKGFRLLWAGESGDEEALTMRGREIQAPTPFNVWQRCVVCASNMSGLYLNCFRPATNMRVPYFGSASCPDRSGQNTLFSKYNAFFQQSQVHKLKNGLFSDDTDIACGHAVSSCFSSVAAGCPAVFVKLLNECQGILQTGPFYTADLLLIQSRVIFVPSALE